MIDSPVMEFRGCGTALITPFADDGTIDTDVLAALVERQIANGIHFLIACGTTAETPTLTEAEWLDVIRLVVEVTNGRVPVMAGCTHNSTLLNTTGIARPMETSIPRCSRDSASHPAPVSNTASSTVCLLNLDISYETDLFLFLEQRSASVAQRLSRNSAALRRLCWVRWTDHCLIHTEFWKIAKSIICNHHSTSM